MMRLVVTNGTAKDLNGSGDVRGKTGEAEFDGGSHAWFAGYRGDMAFAALIVGGGSLGIRGADAQGHVRPAAARLPGLSSLFREGATSSTDVDMAPTAKRHDRIDDDAGCASPTPTATAHCAGCTTRSRSG